MSTLPEYIQQKIERLIPIDEWEVDKSMYTFVKCPRCGAVIHEFMANEPSSHETDCEYMATVYSCLLNIAWSIEGDEYVTKLLAKIGRETAV